MDGINFHLTDSFGLAHINFLSDELKESIRKHLSSICHGADQAASVRVMYNYQSTLATFLERYNSKPELTKIGMIGELLSHVLIIEMLPNYEPVSPFFNLEEKSIKKGFDVLLFSNTDDELWITEVKSGHLHKDKNSSETTKDLLNTAKGDLKKRLNENELNHWQNAIHAARIAIGQNKDYKKVVLDLLLDEGDLTCQKMATSADNNVFLISNLFEESSEQINETVVSSFQKNLEGKGTFKKSMVLSIKKPTYTAIADFFAKEIANA